MGDTGHIAISGIDEFSGTTCFDNVLLLPPAVAAALSAAGIEAAALGADVLAALTAADEAGLLTVEPSGIVVKHDVTLQPDAALVLGSEVHLEGDVTGDASTTVIVGTGATINGNVTEVGTLVYADGARQKGNLENVGTVIVPAGVGTSPGSHIPVGIKGDLFFTTSFVMAGGASLTLDGDLACAAEATASVASPETLVVKGDVTCAALE